MAASAGSRWPLGFAWAILLSGGLGCSNLAVTKVPVAERTANCDDQQGFRYYLNRPYLAVKEPILITETRSLVLVDPVRAAPSSKSQLPSKKLSGDQASEAELTFLTGPRRGSAVRLADLRLENPGSGLVRTVSPEELEKIGIVLASSCRQVEKPEAAPVEKLPPPAAISASFGDGSVTASGGGALRADSGSMAQPGVALAVSSATTAAIDVPTANAPTAGAALKGKMEVLYLPDLDEQYAIKSKNFLAKSAFGLAFKNGCELTEVQGEHDATTLTIAILNQIQAAIGAAQGVEQARIQQQAKLLQANQPSPTGMYSGLDVSKAAQDGQRPVVQLIERTWIKPGVYRLNKPWEIKGAGDLKPIGCGLLAKLGLPTVVDIDFATATSVQIATAPDPLSGEGL
jgi:hypothetical protein